MLEMFKTGRFKSLCMQTRILQICLQQNRHIKKSFRTFLKMERVPKAAAGVRSASSFIHDKAYINGQWVAAASGKTFEVTNPSTGKLIGSVPDMDARDTEKAIQQAYIAQQSWKDVTAKVISMLLFTCF
ncbi:hypothetical protein KUTeg_021250 [Tegillarca granosa]|uniref:Aldehyde dehydrogenase domain-containing protein n=1 Tax=Tegillarca granosa TaxID=220873 RepID=A0ABQ9EG82_TEGGR|nr:hypothetical protein KUTeg_021250 [Tegillarca granosa]